MKRLSITLKITLWFTIFMLILSAIIFGFIALVSESTADHRVRGLLTDRVESNVQQIEYDDGELEIEDEFVSYQHGVYSLVLYENGQKAAGYAPYPELEGGGLVDGQVRSLTVSGEGYLVYDRLIPFPEGNIWVRGVAPESGSAISDSAMYQAALFAVPLLILLASAGGYLLARNSLRPIQNISETAEAIGRSGDLSKRIAAGAGEGSGNGDELQRLAATFNRMFDRLEENFQAERRFTSDASHELRTPVTVILAQCEYAFENASGEEELYEALGVIQKQGYRMSRLIEALLRFTRLEQRTESPEFGIVDVSEVALGVCREQRELSEKNISLSWEIQPGLRMKADAALLAQLLGNLIKNAYCYGKEGGSTHVTLQQQGGELLLSVRDNGIGISAEDLPHIWNRFYRAEKSRSAAAGAGFGLGLAFVRQVAELHGGRVRAESAPDRGTTFIVSLPGAWAPESIGPQKTAEGGSSKSRMA